MKRWGLPLALLACAAFWLVLGVTLAKAEDGQTLAAETSEWIGATLHAPALERTLVVSDRLPAEYAGGVFCDQPREAALQPSVLSEWDAAAAGAFVYDADGVAVVLHELLHRGPEACGSYDPYIEEGITQAMTLDLLPAWSKRFLGEAFTIPNRDGAYAEEVTFLRNLSSVRTGRPWRSYAARQWRRALYLSDRDTRREMVNPTMGGTE